MSEPIYTLIAEIEPHYGATVAPIELGLVKPTVTEVEGPYNDKDELLTHVELGQTYYYYATLNVGSNTINPKQVKWAVGYDSEKYEKQYYLFKGKEIVGNRVRISISIGGNEQIKKKIKEKFKIYAYTGAVPNKDICVKTTIKKNLIKVTTTSGKYLFSLKPNKIHKSQSITAKKLYSKKIQWFCPQADNYLELVGKDENLFKFKELKHFTWKSIVNFSEIERWNISYRSGGSGDWKLSKKGADGYLLVTVNGFPYWADAIGQIPFSIDIFTDNLEDGYSKEEAIKETLSIGQRFGDGKIFGGKSDFSNEYDNHIILRACLWATKRYDIKATSTMMKFSTRTIYSVVKNNFNENNLGSFLTKKQAEKYLK